MTKFVSRFLLVAFVLSVFSISAFASGSSTTPSYPSSTYYYVTGLSSSNTASTRSASYFDAVTGSLVGLGSALGSLNTTLGSIKSNTNALTTYLPGIKSGADNLSTINTYTKSSYDRLGNISTVVSWMKDNWPSGGGSGGSAWTSTQASNVSASVALIEAFTKSTSGNVAAGNVWLEGISDKVSTEATLKTRASESTVSSIDSKLDSFKSQLDMIASAADNLSYVYADDDAQDMKPYLEDESAWLLDYVSGSDRDRVTASDFTQFSNAGSSFKKIFAGAPEQSISNSYDIVKDNSFYFWSQVVSDKINGGASVSTYSDDPSQRIVDAYSENWAQIVGGYCD